MNKLSGRERVRRIWKPRPPTLDTYKFADRAEHERAFAWARQFGPQPGILHADILPPLPRLVEQLLVHAILLSPTGWVDMLLGSPDPRTPWRDTHVPVGRVHPLGPGCDFLLIDPARSLADAGSREGWKVSRLRGEATPPHQMTVHTLYDRVADYQVRFGNHDAAERGVHVLIMSDGAPPCCWQWWPWIDETDNGGWEAEPPDLRLPMLAAIVRRGAHNSWCIVHNHCCRWPEYIVRRRDGDADEEEARDWVPMEWPEVARFDTLVAAKRFCDTEDQACQTAP
jgi:hypothetical protein